MKTHRLMMISLILMVVLVVNVVIVYAAGSDGISQTDEPVESPEDISYVGVIVGINGDDGSLDIEVPLETGELVVFTVQMPDDFDFTTVTDGDSFEITGILGDDGVIVPPEDGSAFTGNGNFCSSPDEEHPTGASIAESYGVEYSDVMGWYCDNAPDGGDGSEDGGTSKTGFGEIKLALETAEITGGSAEELLALRSEGQGWGQIWKELGFNGKPKDDDVLDDETVVEEESGQGSGAENSNGNGPPEHANNDKDKDQEKDKDKENKGKGKDK